MFFLFTLICIFTETLNSISPWKGQNILQVLWNLALFYELFFLIVIIHVVEFVLFQQKWTVTSWMTLSPMISGRMNKWALFITKCRLWIGIHRVRPFRKQENNIRCACAQSLQTIFLVHESKINSYQNLCQINQIDVHCTYGIVYPEFGVWTKSALKLLGLEIFFY